MDNTKQHTVLRQWHIIDLLVKRDHYISSQEVQEHLTKLGFTVDIRTVQRDLKQLQSLFNLECNTSDKPYSWRWQQINDSKQHKLTYRQATIFTLIAKELCNHIPPSLMDQLQPIITRSHYVLAAQHLDDPIELPTPKIPNPMPPLKGPSGFIPPGRSHVPNLAQLSQLATRHVSQMFGKLTNGFSSEPKINKTAIKELQATLNALGLSDLSDELTPLTK